jgi:Prealbumin-like fold domain
VYSTPPKTLVNAPTGYTNGTTWSCDGGSFVSPNKISVPLGGAVTCSITNTDNTPTLKLVKIVTNNDGGTAVANDWTLSAAAAAPNDGRNFSNAGGSGAFTNVFGGVEYTLTESAAPTGYTNGTTWSCDGGSFVSPNKISVPLGGAVTCSITNTDNTPTLKLVKIVVNDDGGDKTAADFKLYAAAPAPNDGRNFNSQTASPIFHSVFAGTGYVLSEDAVTGYTAGTWSCDAGSLVGSTITVPLGTAVTCTITNDDLPGTIIIQKLTKPTGSLTSFPFEATGPGATGTDYVDFSLTGGQSNSQTLDAGSYTVRELVPLGWVLTGIGGSTDPNRPYDCTVTGSRPHRSRSRTATR